MLHFTSRAVPLFSALVDGSCLPVSRRTVTPLLLALAAAACGDGAGVPDIAGSSSIRDSAGVEIVENDGPGWTGREAWTIGEQPRVSIGVLEGAPGYELHDVRDVTRSRAGRILVANSGTSEIRIFDSGGRWVETVGGPGDGPGEFRSIDWIAALEGDTLLAFDLGRRRLTVFGPDREIARIVTFEKGAGLAMERVARLADGSYVLGWDTGDVWGRIQEGAARAGETVRSSALLLHYSSAGSVLDTVGIFPGFEAALRESRGRVRPARAPFGRLISYAARGGEVLVGTQDRFVIRRYTPGGRLVGSVRRKNVDLRVTPSRIDSLRVSVLEGMADTRRRDYLGELFRDGPFPETRAAYGEFQVDPDGNLWVAEYSYAPLAPRRWTVFGPDGALLGEVEAPRGFSIEEVGRDYVLGLRRDGLGVQHVELYALHR